MSQASSPAPTRIRFATPGEGAWVDETFKQCLGFSFPSAVEGVDDGTMQHGYQFLDCLLVIEIRSTGERVGALLAGPPHKYLKAMPRDMVAGAAQIITKLSGIAVLPEHRGRGYGNRLLRRSVAEFRSRDYQWMYGQFSQDPALERFYVAAGFTVRPPGVHLVGPPVTGAAVFTANADDEQWFDVTL